MEERLKAILRLAIKYGATDIHFLLKGVSISIEMRINGEKRRLKAKYNDDKLIRYLQYLANLDLGKQLEPQTGHFEMKVDATNLLLRFAVINGENYCNAVLRILNNNLFSLDKFKISKKDNKTIQRLFDKKKGLIVIAGPTNSGKTMLAYSLLNTKKGAKLYSAEDPVEFYTDDMIQLQVNENIGYDYETTIKQLLRHDPDIIFVGEVRNEKTAKAVMDAVNRDHLVVTTIHSGSDVTSTLKELKKLGVTQAQINNNLLCIINTKKKVIKNKLIFSIKINNFNKEEK